MKIDDRATRAIIKSFEKSKDPIVILNEDFIIQYANEGAIGLFPGLKKYKDREINWTLVWDFIEVSKIEECRQLEGGDYITWEIYYRDIGQWFELSIAALEDYGYLVVLTDITEKIRLKEELNKNNEQLNAFMKTSFDSIYEYNVNSNTISITEVKNHVIVKETIEFKKTYIYPKDRAYVEGEFEKASLNKSICDIEHRLPRKNGNYIWVRSRTVPIIDEDGDIRKWIGAWNDITLEKEFELRLIEKEREYLRLLDGTTMGFYIKDHEKEEIYLSDTWERKVKLEKKDGRRLYFNPYEFVHPEDRENLRKLEKDRTDKKKEKFSLEYRVKLDGDDYIWVLDQGKVIYDKEGRAIKEFGSHVDITDRKLAENKLRQSEEKANKLVAELRKANELKNNFISTLGHELRNPLATMSMGISLLNEVRPGSKVDLRTREIVQRQTDQVIRLVNDLLSTRRIMEDKVQIIKEDIDINGVIKELIEEYKPLFEQSDIELRGEYYNEPIYIDGDCICIKRAIGNLLSNALKFTGEKGLVKLTVFKDGKSNDIIIEVVDTGIGIPPEIIPELFEPFVQLDNSLTRTTSGLGLGLPIAKGLVKLHNGSIEVKSEGLGRGTKFILRFPMNRTQGKDSSYHLK